MNELSINETVRNFIPDTDPRIIGVESGEYNKAYLLTTGGHEYALRIKKKPVQINMSDVAYEIEFMEKLANAQNFIQIPKTIRTTSGDILYEDSEAYYNLQTRVAGGTRIEKWYRSHELSIEDVREIFSKLALLHNASRSIRMASTKNSPTVLDYISDYRVVLKTGLPEGEFNSVLAKNRELLENGLDALELSLHQYDYEKLRRYPTHYDTSAMNVLWKNGKIVSLIDFDWAQDSTFEFDFCHSVMHSCGGYIVGGNTDNLFNVPKVRTAFESYNSAAEAPFGNRRLIEALLDASSFFLAFWGLKTFLEEKNKESYYMSFFQAGVDRLKAPVQSV